MDLWRVAARIECMKALATSLIALAIAASEHPRHVIAFDRISEQFDPGGTGPAPFPSVSGWILPQR